MNTLRNTTVSTAMGALLLIISAIPMMVYTINFRAEDAKLHNGPITSPQFIVPAK